MKKISGNEKKLDSFLKQIGLRRYNEDCRMLNRAYNRILTPDEQKLLDTESFGYLLSLYHIGTIDSIELERFIDYCLCIAYYEEEKLPLERTKKIVSFLLFCDNMVIKNRDFVTIFKECEDEITNNDTIH